MDHNILRSVTIWEVGSGQHTSCIMILRISFGSAVRNWGCPTPSQHTVGGRSGSQSTNAWRWKRVVSYLIYDIDKGLSVAPLETIYKICHFHVREDCLDKGGEFILGDGRADQALQCLTMDV